MKIIHLFYFVLFIILSFAFFNCSSIQPGDRLSKTPGKTDSTATITPPTMISDGIEKKDENPSKVDQQTIADTTKNITNTNQDSIPEPKIQIMSYSEDTTRKVIIGVKNPDQLTFTVQLGVFKEISNVEKFEKNVMNDLSISIKTEFDPKTQAYKVTAGQFPTKEEAYKFRDHCIQKGYKDAWVTKIGK